FSGRHAVARSRSVEGFQSSLRMVAVGPLGIGKRRQSRQGAAVRRYAGGGTGEGERCNRGSGAPHRARLTDRGGCAAPGRRTHRPATKKPRPRAARPGLLPKTVLGLLVADVHPAETGHPTPAAWSDHHDAAETTAPVAVTPVMAATHAAALAAAGGSFGRDERGGADGGDGGDSENSLADHGSLLVFIGWVFASCLSVGRTIRRVQ